ncbi:MAG: oligosaccharide flippase family protein, partial [Pirellulales bacterium]
MLRSIASNWLLLVLSAIVNLLITPLVIDGLSSSYYGVWAFINDLTAYSSLLYFGLGTALVRYISTARQDDNGVVISELVSTVTLMYFGMGLFCLLGMSCISPFVGPWLLGDDLSATSRSMIQAATVLIGVQVLLMFVGSAFAGMLHGYERFDLANAAGMSVLLLRTAAIYLFVQGDNAMLQLAVITTCGEALRVLLLCILAHRVSPQLRIRLVNFSTNILRKIFGFAGAAFVIQLAARLINYTDTVVIGLMIGASATAYYSIAATFFVYGAQFSNSVTSVFMPRLAQQFRMNRVGEFRDTYIRCCSLATLIGTYFAVSVAWLGVPFIRIWIGDEFADEVGWVVIALMVGYAAQVFYAQAPLVLFQAQGSLRGLAVIRISEGVLNLALSLVLGWFYGINGVATATLVSGVLIGLGITPYHSSRAVELPFRTYLVQTLRHSLACAVVLCVVYGGLMWFW